MAIFRSKLYSYDSQYPRNGYSRYDDTDALKSMKDADILAQERRQNQGQGGRVLKKGLMGAIRGAGFTGLAMGTLGAIANRKKGLGAMGSSFLKNAKRGAIMGGMVGGAIGTMNQMGQESQTNSRNRFYNDRLEYAQRKAARRERKDWYHNNNNREGYSY